MHKHFQIWLWVFALGVGAVLIWLGRVDTPTPVSDIPPAPRPGAPAPDFELPTLNGELIRLEDLRGQAVVVNLWATWCPPCRAEMPDMQRVYDEYRDDGLVILAINQREAPAEVQTFVDELGLTFPILMDVKIVLSSPAIIGLECPLNIG